MRTHSIIYSKDFFPSTKHDLRKAQKREIAKFDENQRQLGILNPLRDKNCCMYRGGGEEGTTPVTAACPGEI